MINRRPPINFVTLLGNLATEMKQEKSLLPEKAKLTNRQLYDLNAYAKSHRNESATVAASNRTIMALYNCMKIVSDYFNASLWTNYYSWFNDIQTCINDIDTGYTYIPRIVDAKTQVWGQKYCDVLRDIVTHPTPFKTQSWAARKALKINRFIEMYVHLAARLSIYQFPTFGNENEWSPSIRDDQSYRLCKQFKESIETILATHNKKIEKETKDRLHAMHALLAESVGTYECDLREQQEKSRLVEMKYDIKATIESPKKADPVFELKLQPPLADTETKSKNILLSVDESPKKTPPLETKKLNDEFLQAREDLEKKLEECASRTSWWDWFWGIKNTFNDVANDVQTALTALRAGVEEKITTLSIACFNNNDLTHLEKAIDNYSLKRSNMVDHTLSLDKYNLQRMLSDVPKHSSFWGFLGLGNVFNAMQSHVPALLKLLASEPIKANDFQRLIAPFKQAEAAYKNSLTDQQRIFVTRLNNLFTHFEKHVTPASPLHNSALDKLLKEDKKDVQHRPSLTIAIPAPQSAALSPLSPISPVTSNDSDVYLTPTSSPMSKKRN